MKSHDINKGYKDAWCGENCTLGDRAAKVCGRRHNFATIATITEPFLDVEYAWKTVARIMADGGSFRI